jgi:hypothetical protein
MFIYLTRNKQVSDGPNGTRHCLSSWPLCWSFMPFVNQGIRGSHFFMGTPAKCLPVGFHSGYIFLFPSLQEIVCYGLGSHLGRRSYQGSWTQAVGP